MPRPPGAGPGLGAALSPDNPDSPSTLGVLRDIIGQARWRLAVTYGLFFVENVLRMAQPVVLGWAIDDLLNKSYKGLIAFVIQHVSFMTIGTIRQRYDTRVYSSLTTDMSTRMVQTQHESNVPISAIVARSAMSRQFIEFFDRQVPMVIRSLFSVIGAMICLTFFDYWVGLMCLGLLVPCTLFNSYYGKVTRRLNGKLHDELEREVIVIETGQVEPVREHYHNVAGWRIRLSDSEANNFAGMELFVLILIVGALVRVCTSGVTKPGEIQAVFRYVMIFVMGLDTIPQTVVAVSRLRDIARRMTAGPAAKG